MNDYRKIIGQTVTITVDRPLGTLHPQFPELRYPINYGYIAGIIAGDGSEQDAYLLGVDIPVDVYVGTVIAVIHRLNDVEDKWVVAPPGLPFTKDEIHDNTYFIEQYFKSEIFTA
ncbi:MAG: inorganic pyrophosphatase [Defluviitaleaceae bacterium]|nr:inorganic pyrophosphatase [Defluviitaleaceae bacterium]